MTLKFIRPTDYDLDHEGPYAVINDSASLISRDRRSRVRRHYGHDTDSDISGVTGRSGRRGHQMPGWYPQPGGGYEPLMFRRKGPRSVASSKHSSKDGSHHSGMHSYRYSVYGLANHFLSCDCLHGYLFRLSTHDGSNGLPLPTLLCWNAIPTVLGKSHQNQKLSDSNS